MMMLQKMRKSYPLLLDKTKAESSITKKTENYAATAHIPKFTEELTKQLTYFTPDLKVAPRPPQKMAQLYSKLFKGFVYQIPCKD